MAELTRDIATYLISRHLVTAIGTDVFLDYVPETPDNLLAVQEYAGVPPDIPIPLLDRRVQVLIRNKSYASARTLAFSVFNALDTGFSRPAGVVLTASRTAVINALQSPFMLERDEMDRSIFVFNLAVATTRD